MQHYLNPEPCQQQMSLRIVVAVILDAAQQQMHLYAAQQLL
jgi:hypothetical protein